MDSSLKVPLGLADKPKLEENATQGSLHSRYDKLAGRREAYLTRARDASEITVPTLVPRAGANESTIFPTPWQSLGAQGVKSLSAKLLLSLFPAQAPFFKMVMDPKIRAELEANPELKQELETKLAAYEGAVMDEIERLGVRTTIYEMLQHLLVAGNALPYVGPKGELRLFHLYRYVISRTPMGKVRELIVKEDVDEADIPAEIRGEVKSPPGSDGNKTVPLYTGCVREDDGRYRQWQEAGANGIIIPGTIAYWTEETLPWFPQRFSKVDGESYGRGHVEAYLGDLRSLEGLSEAIVEASAICAKTLWGVKPNAQTSPKELSELRNGGFFEGNPEDVWSLQAEKYHDLQIAVPTSERIEGRLKEAFLLNSAIQRDAERVTAEEIRLMAQELENALGGVYSILSQEFQRPFLNKIISNMERRAALPKLPPGTAKPEIITGLEALGRGAEAQKLQAWAAAIPAPGQGFVKWNSYNSKLAVGYGLDPKDLVMSDQEIQQQQQQAMQQGMLQKLGPKAIDSATKMMTSGAPQPGGDQQPQQ